MRAYFASKVYWNTCEQAMALFNTLFIHMGNVFQRHKYSKTGQQIYLVSHIAKMEAIKAVTEMINERELFS